MRMSNHNGENEKKLNSPTLCELLQTQHRVEDLQVHGALELREKGDNVVDRGVTLK